MTHVDINARLIQVAGHHRQPRSSASWTALPGGSSFDATPSSFVNATAGPVPDAQFVFWSASDGANGQTTSSTSVHQQVGPAALTLTAWYLPIGGDGTPGPTGFLIDAFSVAHGDFVDDDFVTVTSDPSLTSQANVAGFVPTTRAQTVEAFTSVASTGEAFEQWIGAPAVDRDATFAAKTDGFAIATYKKSDVHLPKVDVPREGWIIFGGIDVDGPGWVIPIGGGGGGGGGPVGPWGPFMERVSKAFAAGALGASLKGKRGLQMQLLAAEELAGAARAHLAAMKRQQG
jgi:hypothetical protein